MSGCTATIRVDGQTITCTSHDELSMYTHSDGLLGWSDLAPGATPAKPQYRAKKFGTASWTVWSEEERDWSAIYSARHPDPRGAAEAEADRLNDHSGEALRRSNTALIRERDEARVEAEEHRLRANENFDEALRWRGEADRYRDALRTIGGPYARRVLDGGQP